MLAEDEPRCASWWPILHKRVLQHNLRTCAAAFSRVSLARLSALTATDAPTLEAQLCELVAGKSVAALIDRPAGTVAFGRPRAPARICPGF